MMPLPVPHEDEGEDAVEGGHHDVCHGEVEEVVIGGAPHPFVSCIRNTYQNHGFFFRQLYSCNTKD